MVNMSFVFMIVTGSFSILFNPPIILKILNYFILSASLLVQFENLVGQTVFIRSMDLIDNGEKLSITTHKGKTKVLLTKNLKKAINTIMSELKSSSEEQGFFEQVCNLVLEGGSLVAGVFFMTYFV